MFEIASPYGPLPIAGWTCLDCQSGRSRYTAETAAETLRDEATAHGRTTGHMTVFHRGAEELLMPLATTAARAQIESPR